MNGVVATGTNMDAVGTSSWGTKYGIMMLENTFYNIVASAGTGFSTCTASACLVPHGPTMRNVLCNAEDYGIKNERGLELCVAQNDIYDCGDAEWADSDAVNLGLDNLEVDPDFVDADNGDLEPRAAAVRESVASGRALGAVSTRRSGPSGRTMGSPITGAF